MAENPYVAASSMSPLAVRVPSCLCPQCLSSLPTHQITNFIGKAKRLQLHSLQIHSVGLGVPLLHSSATSPFGTNEPGFPEGFSCSPLHNLTGGQYQYAYLQPVFCSLIFTS